MAVSPDTTLSRPAAALPTAHARLAGVGVALPEAVRTSAEIEALIRAVSPACRLRSGLVQAMTGVRERRLAADGTNCSDLAAAAGAAALADAGVDADEVDLLVFAAAGQDLLEPATANIVQEKVGTSCPVFDLKNACNSFLDAVGVAEGLVAAGVHRHVLVTTGELPSRAIRFDAADERDLRLNFPGYTMGDGGGAVLVGPAADAPGGHLLYRESLTVSRYWDLATLPGGGSMRPRGDEWTYLRGDGAGLRQAFAAVGPDIVERALEATGTTSDDFARVLVHQVTIPYLHEFTRITGIPFERVELTLPSLGNMAAASLPVAYAQALRRGALRRGDLVLWVGLAGGISMHVLVTEV